MIERGPFRQDEIACALALLDAALGRADTYEALIAVVADDRDPSLNRGRTPERDLPVGYLCFGATPMTEGTYDVYWILVDPDQQGRGVGRQLMAEVERLLSARGARTIRIETSSLEGQGGAARFYEQTGFARVGRIADFYRDGDDLVTFAKRLS